MKYLIFIGLFAAGGVTGYFVGANQSYNEVEIPSNETELITEFIYDTIIEQERIEVPVYRNPADTVNEEVDTLNATLLLDTLKNNILPRDTTSDEGLNIKRDEQVATKRIPIIYLKSSIEKDSIIKDLLGIKENLPTEMVAQFWSSPLNFSGYKLSKNSLILYGLSEQYDYTVYHKDETYYLTNEAVFYVLRETQQFLSYSEVDQASVLND
ncbi:MAG: hypothetical protein GQ574_27980 [Crocinitomix sp.]|nr:hypothetical protein [Crocinitomix sp.]